MYFYLTVYIPDLFTPTLQLICFCFYEMLKDDWFLLFHGTFLSHGAVMC